MQVYTQIPMRLSTDERSFLLDALRTAIARSPIAMHARVSRLPAGFEAVDAAVLDWIMAEARQLRRGVSLM
jgi:hypothetical protein